MAGGSLNVSKRSTGFAAITATRARAAATERNLRSAVLELREAGTRTRSKPAAAPAVSAQIAPRRRATRSPASAARFVPRGPSLTTGWSSRTMIAAADPMAQTAVRQMTGQRGALRQKNDTLPTARATIAVREDVR